MQHQKTAGCSLLRVGALASVILMSTACSGGGDDGQSDMTYTWWDPYPQHEENSDWAQRVQACGEAAGVTIERTAYDTTDLTNQALLAAQEGTSPDVIDRKSTRLNSSH